jgi:hypothetical protein
MFELVRCEKMVVGNKYKIKTACKEFTGIYTGPVPDKYQYSAFIFSNVKDERNYGSVLFSTYHSYYKFVSKNPQEKMERRAVNMILQGILGDHFEW